MKFSKYQGCGNDFLILDMIQVQERTSLSPSQIEWLCDRHYGLGADGLVVLLPSGKATARWIFYNCDGIEAEMCGNAARCVLEYLQRTHAPGHLELTLETSRGVLRGSILSRGQVEVCFPFFLDGVPDLDQRFVKNEQGEVWTVFLINTGVPHAVLEVETFETAAIQKMGQQIQKHAFFQPDQTNVTFFQRRGMGILSTTFERGVEAQTLACGTGVIAAATVFSQLYATPFPIEVEVPGGHMRVDFRKGEGLFLRGEVNAVYKAELESVPHGFNVPKPFGVKE